MSTLLQAPCPHCQSDTHKSSCSKLCQFHTKSTDELLQDAVGENFEHVTRKCSLGRAIRTPFQETFHSEVLNLCEYVRWVIILTHDKAVSGTNSKLPLTELNQAWEELKAAHTQTSPVLG
jgi:hypothetical protein